MVVARWRLSAPQVRSQWTLRNLYFNATETPLTVAVSLVQTASRTPTKVGDQGAPANQAEDHEYSDDPRSKNHRRERIDKNEHRGEQKCGDLVRQEPFAKAEPDDEGDRHRQDDKVVKVEIGRAYQ